MTTKIDPDSIVMWSDGTWCYWEDMGDMGDMGDMNHMSDDYEIIPYGTDEYWKFLYMEEAM